MSRNHRTYVRLPKELARKLDELAKRQGVTVSALCYMWVIEAARLAHQGHGHRLPQQRRAPRGSLLEAMPVRWLQGVEEYTRCRELIEASGSTVSAVVRAGAQEYVDADGDVLAMDWPPKRAGRKAA